MAEDALLKDERRQTMKRIIAILLALIMIQRRIFERPVPLVHALRAAVVHRKGQKHEPRAMVLEISGLGENRVQYLQLFLIAALHPVQHRPQIDIAPARDPEVKRHL